MVTLALVLLILAFAAFALAAFNVAAPRVNLLGLGLALWVLSLIVGHVSA
jgi:hypothetical protein